MFQLLFAGLTLLMGCPSQPGEVTSYTIEVTPGEVSIETGPDLTPETIQYTATVVPGPDSAPPTGTITWSLTNPDVGTISADGLFTASTDFGGRTEVVATLGDVTGSAALTSKWIAVIDHPDVDPTWFEGTPSVMDNPEWLYPQPGAFLPKNVPSVLFSWSNVFARGYRMVFATETINLTVYLNESSWTASQEDWQRITRSNAGEAVTCELRASLDDEELWQAEELEIEVDSFDATGSIIYWSSSVAGMLEIPFGGVAQDFYTRNDAGTCVGCHQISSRGIMSYTRNSANGVLALFDVSTRMDIELKGIQGTNFQAFSPDGTRLLNAFQGTITLHDGENGSLLSTVLQHDLVTMPDWAPDGQHVVFVRSDACGSNYDLRLCPPSVNTIERMSVSGDTFGTPEILYTAPAGELAYYPVHSPDSQWIVFNRSTGDSYDDTDASLWAIRTDGSGEAVELAAANLDVNLTNSWPRFAPPSDEADVFWLTFASKRTYDGRRVPQIWISAFNPEAGPGEDPTKPAFWLPGQNPSQNNHIPAWVEIGGDPSIQE